MAGKTEKAAAAASAPFRAANHLRTDAEIAAYVESVLADGDRRAVPVALRTVAQAAAALESPVWHRDALREIEQRSKAGQEQSIDWDAAKRELRERKMKLPALRLGILRVVELYCSP